MGRINGRVKQVDMIGRLLKRARASLKKAYDLTRHMEERDEQLRMRDRVSTMATELEGIEKRLERHDAEKMPRGAWDAFSLVTKKVMDEMDKGIDDMFKKSRSIRIMR